MPWVQYWRSEKRKKNDPFWNEYLNCYKCMDSPRMTESVRASMGCGLMRADQRTGYFNSPLPWDDVVNHRRGESYAEQMERCSGTICPGYVVSLPQVQEAALCAAWQDKGSLESRLDGEPVTGLLRECIDEVRGASNAVESHMLNGGG